METLKFDLSKEAGTFKVLNATNGGPWHKRYTTDQLRSNFADYKAARIPYSRNHDSGVCSIYGGPYSHDISRIFPNFDADENDPASYDFACTDEDILCTLDAGTETYFRLGETIEHQIKKHATLPPKDFHKWARICEHIIRHYNYGWADGFHLNIKYWEIWGEPNLDADDSTNKRLWGGTKAEFFELFKITAKHLKKCFPELKICSPGFAGDTEETGYEQYLDDFFAEMKKENIDIDFCSWHLYANEPQLLVEQAERIKEVLIKNGYDKTESICSEWNYVKDWEEKFQYSINTVHGLKGAAFTMATISAFQKCDDIDMAMYYDTRPAAFNGVFDFYSYEPLKGYYPLMWYGKFYDMKSYIKCENEIENIYTLCGIDEGGKAMCVVTNYADENPVAKDIKLDFGKEGKYEIYMVDEEKNGELVATTENLEFTLSPYSFILIREI